MIFLIEYDRPKGQLVKFKSFVDSDRLKAQDMRLELELSLHRSGVDHEVVLLEAVNEAAQPSSDQLDAGHHCHCARNKFVSCGCDPPRLLANTSHFPSGLNIGKLSNCS